MEWLKANYVMLIALFSVLINIAWIVLGCIHLKKGHKIPDAQKIAKKQAKQELKAKYKAAKKALNAPADDSKGK